MPAALVVGLSATCVILSRSLDEGPAPDARVPSPIHICDGRCGHSLPAWGSFLSPDALDPKEREKAMERSQAFKRWLTDREDETGWNESDLDQGRRLAMGRRDAMKLLLRRDPKAALEEALGYAEYAALPESIRPLVEEPFSTTGQLEVQIACGAESREFHRLIDERGKSLELSMPARHRVGLTKHGLPVQGIRLDDLATVRANPFQVVEGPDADYVSREWPSGQGDPSLSFDSGLPIEGEGVTAVLGGLVFHFQDLEALAAVEEVLTEADARPGRNSGSRWLVEAAAGGTLLQFPEQQFVQQTIQAAYDTTTGAKTALFIMVDFSDAPGQPFDAGALEQVVDNDCNDGLIRYSYNQTNMNGTVHGTVYRMPSAKATYVGAPGNPDDDNHSQLHDDAVAAYVNDGNPDPFANYDTVCVVMTDIGFTWSGLGAIGGQQMWLHNSISAENILHEFGHNYGLRHANYWVHNYTNPNSTNPVDPGGANEEYGDLYDLMGDGNVADGHFSPAHKIHLGWIPGSDWEDLSNSGHNGTYRITRFDDKNATGRRGLRINKSATGDHYWVGYRRDYSELESFANGAYLSWERAGGDPARNQCWLVDTTPLSANGKADSPITLGRTYSDTASDVHITAVAVGGSAPNEWLDVTVNFGPFPGNNNPAGTLIGPTAVDARRTMLFNVEATDPDGDTLAYSWDMGDGRVKSNSPTAAHAWAQGGSYDVKVTISDMKGGKLTLQQTVTVSDPLAIWTARTSGTANHLSRITANDTHVVIVGGGVYPYADGVKILRSANGVTWSNVTPSGTGNASFKDVCWTGSEFVAVGEDFDFGVSGWEGVIYDSADGSSWTRRFETNAANTQLYCVATDGSGVVVAGGFSGTVIRRTSEGAWSSVASGIPSTHGLRGAAHGDGTFVVVGHPNYQTGNEVVWTSGDGISWTDRTSGSGLPNAWEDLNNVHYTGSLFVAGGSYARARYSTDQGQNWLSNQTGDRHQISGFATGTGLTYGVGINRDDSDADIDIISTDGQNWIVVNPGSLTNRNGIASFDDTFITVGNNGTIRQSDQLSGNDSYSKFATTHFPGGGNDALPASNPDADWADNLTEYALGGIPVSGSSFPPVPVFSFNGSNNPVLEVSRLERRSDVAYSVWWSTDLQNWTRQGLTIETDNDTTLRVIGDGVDTSGGRGFLRLHLDR